MPAIRRFLMLLPLLLPCHPGSAADGAVDFHGTWTAWVCPVGIEASPEKCASFVLALFQKEDRLCGSHVFATVGASQMDEGGIPSISGMITNNTAMISVESSRAAPPTRINAVLLPEKGLLRWQRQDSPPGDYLLPRFARLTRSRHATLFNPVFEQRLSAACSLMLNSGVENAAPRLSRP